MKTKISYKRLALLASIPIALVAIVLPLYYIYSQPKESINCELDSYTQQYLQNTENNGDLIGIEVFLGETKEGKHSQWLRSFFLEINNTVSNVTVTYSSLEDSVHAPYMLLSHGIYELKIKIDKHVEYNFVKGLTTLLQQRPRDIAFIEGHGEIEQVYLLDAETILSESCNVHRGRIEPHIGVLDNFTVIVIAGPQTQFSEAQKLVIDQYIMQGGKVLWLVDGVYLSDEDLKQQGWSASMPNNVNISDILYTYGAVIKPQLVQDKSSMLIKLISEDSSKFVSIPNFYSPKITLFDKNNFILKDLESVHLDFASPVYPLKDNEKIKTEIFLSSSKQSKLVSVPEKIEYSTANIRFDANTIPLALALEGEFNSFFRSDILPVDIDFPIDELKQVSVPTKMVVIGSSRLFNNSFRGNNIDTEILPIGYDRDSDKITSDNRELLTNIIDWLVENDELLALKAKD